MASSGGGFRPRPPPHRPLWTETPHEAAVSAHARRRTRLMDRNRPSGDSFRTRPPPDRPRWTETPSLPGRIASVHGRTAPERRGREKPRAAAPSSMPRHPSMPPSQRRVPVEIHAVGVLPLADDTTVRVERVDDPYRGIRTSRPCSPGGDRELRWARRTAPAGVSEQHQEPAGQAHPRATEGSVEHVRAGSPTRAEPSLNRSRSARPLDRAHERADALFAGWCPELSAAERGRPVSAAA